MLINPYQPLGSLAGGENRLTKSIESNDSLLFHATIEESDYLALLPPRDFEVWLYLVLGFLLAICDLLALTVVAMGIDRTQISVALSAGVACVLITMGIGYVWHRIRPQTRARRGLKRNPDVLGPADGCVERSGLLFHDGIRQYWFAPSALQNAKVTPKGIRIHLGEDAYRYLALTENT